MFISLFSQHYHSFRLNPERFIESIRTLLDNKADNEQFDAFFQLMIDQNVCIVYFCDYIIKNEI